MTSALLGLQEHWTNVGVQQEKQRSQTEKMQLLKSLLNAGVDETILRNSFNEEEIQHVKAMLHS